MPELPDVEIYVEHLTAMLVGQRLKTIRFNSPFVLRSVVPPIGDAHNHAVCRITRLGKQIVLSLEDDLHLVFHLMFSGRLRWRKPGSILPKGIGLVAFDFESGFYCLLKLVRKTRFVAIG